MIFYPEIFLRSGNTIARACNRKIEPVSDYKMGYLLLALGKVFGGAGTFLPKKVPANRIPDKSKFEKRFIYRKQVIGEILTYMGKNDIIIV